MSETLTWPDVVSGDDLIPMVRRVLRGHGTVLEREFVFMKMNGDTVAAIATAELTEVMKKRKP